MKLPRQASRAGLKNKGAKEMATYEVGFIISQYYRIEVDANSADDAQAKAVMYGPATLRRIGTLMGEHVEEVEVNEDALMFGEA